MTSLSIFVPTGSESALNITPLARSMEKNTESRFAMTSSSSLSEKAVTATFDGVRYISTSSVFSLQDTTATVAAPARRQPEKRRNVLSSFTLMLFACMLFTKLKGLEP